MCMLGVVKEGVVRRGECEGWSHEFGGQELGCTIDVKGSGGVAKE